MNAAVATGAKPPRTRATPIPPSASAPPTPRATPLPASQPPAPEPIARVESAKPAPVRREASPTRAPAGVRVTVGEGDPPPRLSKGSHPYLAMYQQFAALPVGGWAVWENVSLAHYRKRVAHASAKLGIALETYLDASRRVIVVRRPDARPATSP